MDIYTKKDAGLPAIAGGKPVRETKIYYGHQYIDEADVEAVVDVLRANEKLRNG